MANKEYVFGFALQAALDKNFNTTFAGASTNIMGLNKRVRECQEVSEAVTQACKRGNISWASYSNALRRAGEAYTPLMERQKQFLEVQAKINSAQLGLVKHSMNFINATAMFGKIKDWAQPAIEFESAMADVRKVVDFDSDTQFKDMGNDILELSTKIPMAANGLAQIVAAGGQSGIARGDLMQFAEAAAKMGVAFDITAEQAGDMMAKWRTAFKINQKQVETLADQINYLGNTTAASAPKISEVVTRIGPLGEIGGVTSAQIAAISASMVGAGVEAEIAATGIKNMMLALVAGENATKSQSTALEELGFNAETVAQDMQKDAQSTIMGIMQAIKGLSDDRQASIMQQLFGKESLAPISTLTNNLDNLQANFAKVADEGNYANSMEAEFTARSQTTANSIQLLENKTNKAKIAIGNGLLPVIAPVIESLGVLAGKVGEVATAYPELTAIVGGTASVMAVAVAGFSLFGGAIEGAKLAYNSIKFAVIAYRNAEIAKNAVLYAGTVAAKIYAAAQWLINSAMYGCPIAWIIAGIAAIVAAGWYLYNNWESVTKALANAWQWLKDKVLSVGQALIDFYLKLPEHVAFAVGAIIGYFASLPGRIAEAVVAIGEWLMQLPAKCTEAGQLFVQSAGTWASDAYNAVVEWISKIPSAISNYISGAWQGIKEQFSAGFSIGVAANNIQENATGGIYPRGAFLTTFAEDSGESAIPHTPTPRNIGLLARTNEIMGSPLGGNAYNISIPITVNGGADNSVATDIAGQVEAAVKRALESISNQQRRVSFA